MNCPNCAEFAPFPEAHTCEPLPDMGMARLPTAAELRQMDRDITGEGPRLITDISPDREWECRYRRKRLVGFMLQRAISGGYRRA